MRNAQEICTDIVRDMPPAEQLRLATAILDGLTATAAPILDYADSWSDEDIADVQAFSLRHAADAAGNDTVD